MTTEVGLETNSTFFDDRRIVVSPSVFGERFTVSRSSSRSLSISKFNRSALPFPRGESCPFLLTQNPKVICDFA